MTLYSVDLDKLAEPIDPTSHKKTKRKQQVDLTGEKKRTKKTAPVTPEPTPEPEPVPEAEPKKKPLTEKQKAAIERRREANRLKKEQAQAEKEQEQQERKRAEQEEKAQLAEQERLEAEKIAKKEAQKEKRRQARIAKQIDKDVDKLQKDEPPKWFQSFVQNIKSEQAKQTNENVPMKTIIKESKEAAKKSWHDGMTRDRVKNEVESHMGRMYSMIFTGR